MHPAPDPVSRKDLLRFIVRSAVLDSRLLGAAYVRRRAGYGDRRITPDTELVIEGFPRSANSYARWAFELAAERDGTLAGHTHAAAVVREAARSGVPVIVLVRRPEDAVASLVQMRRGANLTAGFQAYARFHRRVHALGGRVMVARFEDVVGDFGAVLDRAGRTFATNLPAFEASEDTLAAVQDLVEQANRRRNDGVLLENTVSRPSAGRQPVEQVLASMGPLARWQHQRARHAYERLLTPDQDGSSNAE